MKRIVLAVAALIVTVGAFAQEATVKKAENLVKFKELVHNFDKIPQGKPVTTEFAFTNVSDKPLVIESATASCGCTTPVKPEAPIGKGKSDKITAGFNAAAPGVFKKIIYVKVAGVDQPLELQITGEVLSAEEYAKYEKEKGSKKG